MSYHKGQKKLKDLIETEKEKKILTVIMAMISEDIARHMSPFGPDRRTKHLRAFQKRLEQVWDEIKAQEQEEENQEEKVMIAGREYVPKEEADFWEGMYEWGRELQDGFKRAWMQEEENREDMVDEIMEEFKEEGRFVLNGKDYIEREAVENVLTKHLN